jgi:hypothetical protein
MSIRGKAHGFRKDARRKARANKREMEFDPRNNVIRLCLQGMGMEEKGDPEEASRLFLQAWNEATNDFEKYTAAYYVPDIKKCSRQIESGSRRLCSLR